MSSRPLPGPPAVVVGLCAHGLSTVRSLGRRGVAVHALESNGELPGTRTRFAQVHMVPAITGELLVDALVKLAHQVGGAQAPVLFVMNDNMVRDVARFWTTLEPLYRLSWASTRDRLTPLLDKQQLERRCVEVGLNYPETRILRDCSKLAQEVAELSYPVLIKPARPLGRFKAQTAQDPAELSRLVTEHHDSLPLLAQRYIPGDDDQISFCALYLDAGRIVVRFDGRKLASLPPARGQTTVAAPTIDDEVFDVTRRFFDGLALSGPVSLEIKRDTEGRPWVIEPTVGRTDYWLPVCTANGVDLPYLEYCHVIGQPPPVLQQSGDKAWFDTERDPGCYLRHTVMRREVRPWDAVFPYLTTQDVEPFLAALRRQLHRTSRSIVSHCRRVLHVG